MKISFLYGLTLKHWWQLARNRHYPSPRYWLRAFRFLAMALFNSITSYFDSKIKIAVKHRGPSFEAPLYILGFWRSGTTLLHNLLAHDHRFAYPTTYQVIHPNSYLFTENMVGNFTGNLVPKNRPQDEVRLSWALPNEDDIALCSMTPFTPYLALAYPQEAYHFLKYIHRCLG